MKTFATYGIPDELSSDGGPKFIAHTTRSFLSDWVFTTILALLPFLIALQSRSWSQDNQVNNN